MFPIENLFFNWFYIPRTLIKIKETNLKIVFQQEKPGIIDVHCIICSMKGK